MAGAPGGGADRGGQIQSGFRTQVRALLRKNLAYQARNRGTNCCMVLLPVFFCGLLAALQYFINYQLSNRDNSCGCKCVECCVDSFDPVLGGERAECYKATAAKPCPLGGRYRECREWDDDVCGLEYSKPEQMWYCSIDHPAPVPPLMQFPYPPSEGDDDDLGDVTDRFPTPNVAPVMYTGRDRAFAKKLAGKLIYELPAGLRRTIGMLMELWKHEERGEEQPGWFSPNDTAADQVVEGMAAAAEAAVGAMTITTEAYPLITYYAEENSRFRLLQKNCTGVETIHDVPLGGGANQSVDCMPYELLEMAGAEAIDDTLFCAFPQALCGAQQKATEYIGAWNFKDSSASKLAVDITVNDTNSLEGGGRGGPPSNLRLPKVVNMATQAFVRETLGEDYEVLLVGGREMPKPAGRLTLAFSSLLGPLFYMWLLQMFLPVYLTQLVDEREQRIRLMMKLQGLQDRAYWIITYVWFLTLYVAFAVMLMIFGGPILTAAQAELPFFTMNDSGIIFLFFFLYGNIQIALVFVLCACFKTKKSANVTAYIWVFASSLLCGILFNDLIEQDRWFLPLLELIPGFGLYRGLFDLGNYSFLAAYQNKAGMTFATLSDKQNGMLEVWIIFIAEWPLLMLLAYYLDQVLDLGTGIKRDPLFFLESFGFRRKMRTYAGKDTEGLVGAASLTVTSPDVVQETKRVQAMATVADMDTVTVRNLRKVFRGENGLPDKVACKSLSLGIQKGECFGLLGPNGAGKTTAINMMVGFLEPDEGEGVVAGMDLQAHIKQIYAAMGVCPQHDLLWPTLTGREHLRFYGALKNLQGPALAQAVDQALGKVNLLGDGNKQVGKYSGGMKRRLSVAVSLIGKPLVVYMDEPSTGLDPASRRQLWRAVQEAKQDTAVVLTTHSMEEAEVLCDRLGIFVDGEMLCVGAPKALTLRHGGYYVFTISVAEEHLGAAKAFVLSLAGSAKLAYEVGCTLKYEVPVEAVELAAIFQGVEDLKQKLPVTDWGVAHATLEEVFIKFAKEAGVAGGG